MLMQNSAILNVAEIFSSINGECTAAYQGSFCTFIRLSGCNCRCCYCDTPQTWEFGSGTDMTIDEILNKTSSLRNKKITITGGEPLSSENVWELIQRLFLQELHISVETNGSINFHGKRLWTVVNSWIVDFKLEGSGMRNKMVFPIFLKLRKTDFVKFAIFNHNDLTEAIKVAKLIQSYYDFINGPNFAFSPVISKEKDIVVSPQEIFDEVSKANIPNALINIQIHKFWGFK
jgi:7-carboxy-7-deazaguanine synthase